MMPVTLEPEPRFNGCWANGHGRQAPRDEGIKPSIQYCRSLPNVWLTNAAVTDEGIVAAGQHWHSLSNVLRTITPVRDEGITALLQ